MMRLAAYTGTSMVLATGVIVRALHQRTNFYSASVYIAQSNACLMILTNLVLLGLSLLMIALQRLAYGPLRVIEVEQLYEKAWFAITETCLAMTIFRDEVGGWFLVMFVSLLIGKVWVWLGEGRLETLEQQPPSNPRVFHLRLSLSLTLSVLFDSFMLKYSIQTVREQAEPNMMVMFAFEFAVLSVTSLASAAKYAIFIHERAVIKEQLRLRRQEGSANIRQQSPESARGLETSNESLAIPLDPSHENDGDSEDDESEVPGWETKGFWVFYLDLLTDFLKLILYLSFFSILCVFYGMPLHIIRDVAITIRSFYKRIHDFLRYRQATRDMNERYADATIDEMAREDVCIICRETMRVWTNEPTVTAGRQPSLRQADQRLRPKKLPCGHILHFACLRSWLERQQNCPTCRRPVLNTSSLIRAPQPQAQDQQQRRLGPVPRGGLAPAVDPAQPLPNQNRVRVFNLGPFRLGIGAGQDLRGLANQMNHDEHHLQPNRSSSNLQQEHTNASTQATADHHLQNNHEVQLGIHSSPRSSDMVERQLHAIEQQLMQQIHTLQAQSDQLYLVRALQGELARIRMNNQNITSGQAVVDGIGTRPSLSNTFSHAPGIHMYGAASQIPQSEPASQNLPPGLSLPDGWNLLPLRRVSDTAAESASSQRQSSGPSFPNTRSILNLPSGDLRSSEDPASTDLSTSNNEDEGGAGSVTRKKRSVGSTHHFESGDDHDGTVPSVQDPLKSRLDGTYQKELSGDESGPSNASSTRGEVDGDLKDPEATLVTNSNCRTGGRHAMVEDQGDDST